MNAAVAAGRAAAAECARLRAAAAAAPGPQTSSLGVEGLDEAAPAALGPGRDAEASALRRARDDARGRVRTLERQNELLHAQVSLAAATVDRLQGAAARDGGAEDAENEGGAGGGAPGTRDDEVRDLREVVVFVRREKEVAEAKLAVSVRDGERAAARARSSDEAAAAARAERDALLRERDGHRAQGLGDDAQQRRDAAAQQLSLLRESNATLRAEANGAKAASDSLRGELRRLRERVADPRDRQKAELKAKLDAAERAKESHERDATAWRRRVDALLARGATAVDAEAHRIVEDRARRAEDAADDVKKRLAELNRASRAARARHAQRQ